MPTSNGWPLSITQRDYTRVTTGGVNGSAIIDRMNGLSNLDDCAAACDNNPQCKSFGMFAKNGSTACALLSTPDPSVPNGWFQGDSSLVMYKQNSRKDLGTTVTTKAISATRFDENGNMFQGRFYDGGNGPVSAGSQFTTNHQNGCHMQYNWDGYPTSDTTGNPGGCDHGDCCILNQLGAQACQIPGVVTSAQPTGGSADTQVTCTYKSIDPTWLNNNIEQLGNYFDGPNTNRAGLMWCNNLSTNDLYSNQTKCQGFATSPSDYRAFLVNKLQGSSWYTDTNASNMVLGTACGAGDQSLNSQCASAIGGIPSTIPSSALIDAMNEAVTNGTSVVQGAISAKVDSICSANSSNPACACYNIYKKQLPGCAANPTLPGCNSADMKAAVQAYNLVNGQTDAQSKTLLAELTTMDGDTLDAFQACITAENTGSGVLLPAKRPGNSLNINQCITSTNLTGAAVSSSQFLQQCNISQTLTTGGPSTIPPAPSAPSAPTTTTGGSPSTTTTDSSSTTSVPYWLWIILVICCCFVVMGGLVAFTRSRKP